MAEEARVFFLRKRRERAEDTERRALLEGLGQTRSLIAQAYAGFNAAKDPDLIESYVFEINALQARYSYLLRRVKELDGRRRRSRDNCGGATRRQGDWQRKAGRGWRWKPCSMPCPGLWAG